MAPDGERIAVSIANQVWIYNRARENRTRLTYESGSGQYPLWSPDGKRVTFRSFRGGAYNLYWTPADGSGPEERLTESRNWQTPGSWSPDGRLLAFTESNVTTGADIWLLPLEGEREPRPFLETEFDEFQAQFSPDGAWMAYTSDQTGRDEVYVRAFPGPGRMQQISLDGGTEPLWRPDGGELFFRNGNEVMAVTIEGGTDFLISNPTLLFEGAYAPGYDVTRDGRRFLMVQSDPESAPNRVHIVLNWSEELERLAPTEN